MTAKPSKRVQRLLSLGALIAAIAAFRNRKLAADEARFNH